MRVGFTIALNALHHFKHNDYAWKLAKQLDHWVIVEGAAGSTGSTSWCKTIPEEYHDDGLSTDGTTSFLQEFEIDHSNVHVAQKPGGWANKDEMVNEAVKMLRKIVEKELNGDFSNVFLWQIDADEQWALLDMAAAETEITDCNCDVGEFYANYYLGDHLMAIGEWGEGKKLPYRRLWNWNGQMFKTHEPPQLEDCDSPRVLCPQRFNHYAYKHECDVQFKDAWYSGHEGIYDRWLLLQQLEERDFPRPIRELITGPWGETDTQIVWI